MQKSTRFPSDLKVHRVWVSQNDSDGRHAIALVSELRRRTIGGVVIGLGLVVLLGVLILRLAEPLIVVGLVISGAGFYYSRGGRSGFYEVGDDGSPGRYLGRSQPDLDEMRGMRP